MILLQLMLMLNSYPKVEYFSYYKDQIEYFEDCNCNEFVLDDDPLELQFDLDMN